MTQKKHLLIAIFILGAFGILFIGNIFRDSLGPSARAEANRPNLNIAKLEIGTFQTLDTESIRYLILKDYDSFVHVYWLPFPNNVVHLPDRKWFRASYPCADFRPEMSDGKIKKDGRILCHDSDNIDAEFTWSYKGENLGDYTEDMIVAKHRIDRDYLVFLSP